MIVKRLFDKVSDKPNAPSDWNNSLKAIWASDKQRPSIYTIEQSRHYWDEGNGRTSVQEHSR